MPNTREKLIELVTAALCNQSVEEVADHLIANGVTIQKWIPVSERLPEPFVSVLACIPSEAPLPIVHESYIADHDKWVCILTAERYKSGEVTHWMPLPPRPEDVK